MKQTLWEQGVELHPHNSRRLAWLSLQPQQNCLNSVKSELKWSAQLNLKGQYNLASEYLPCSNIILSVY